MARIEGEKTQYPGVYRLGENQFRVRAQVTDPRTGKRRERDRQFEGTAKEADRLRADLERELLEQPATTKPTASGLPRRPTVGAFAAFWLATKKPSLDPETLRRYIAALDLHALPALGDFYCDALLMADVQAWINAELAKVDAKGEPVFARSTVHSWFRSFRTMMRDAVAQLRLGHDPTMRISFPEILPKYQGDNRLTAAELQPFLDELRIQAPQVHAITCVLAWTGLRFCHASALKWEDVDWHAKTIVVQRKNVKGRIGPVSRKKRAPEILPMTDELDRVLKWQRRRLMKMGSGGAGDYRNGQWAAKGMAEGWMFPARGRRKKGVAGVGPIHSSGSLRKAWEKTVKGMQEGGKLDEERFTVHGLRRTFNDLLNAGKVDERVKGELTAQSPAMRRHYSTTDVEQLREAMRAVMKVAKGGAEGTAEGTGQKKEGGGGTNLP